MDRLKTTLITAFVLAILFTPGASAQAIAARVDVISGNGQMICPSCPGKLAVFFYPMVVKVTDASGKPIAGKTVNWQLISSTGAQPPSFDSITVTDSNGLSIARLSQASQSAIAQAQFFQSVIVATADSASASFTETQALANFQGTVLIYSRFDAPVGTDTAPAPPLKGPAGGIGPDPIRIHIPVSGVPVPNVSVRILSRASPDSTGPMPSASCATGVGADPGSVLTDANGDAVCYPVFGATTGTAYVSVLIAGLDPAQFDQSISPQPLYDPIAYEEYYNKVQIVVDPVTAGLVSIVSGNNQSLNPGTPSAPLVVKVTDATGAVPIGATSVSWTVSPAGAATLSTTVSTSDSKGLAQTTATLSPSAVGQVTVRAALLAGLSGIGTTFTLSANVQIASLTKVSGDQQTAQANQNFAAPLIVQVMGTNGQPAVGQPVSFSVNGPATLSRTSAPTDASGRAQVSVQAGATPGTVTVSAFVGNISQTFTLTVVPPGPVLSSGSFYSVGGGARLSAVSPCGLVTVIASGIAPNVQGLVVNSNAFGPWATTLATDRVTVNNVAAPISSVGNVNGVEQLTFQVPCDTAPAASVPITINVGGGAATVNFPVQAASPGIFETVMSDNVRRAVAIRPDGAFVSLQNPARRGEVVRVFVTGMGPSAPALASGAFPVPGADSLVLGQVIVGVNNAGARVVSSRAATNLIGAFEIAFQVPSDALTGNDVVFSVAVNAPGDSQTRFSNGSKLPIQ